MASVPYWSANGIEGSAWDACWIGKHYLPGLVTIECDKVRDIDVQKSPEVDGARQVNKGIEPAKVKIKLRLFNNPDAFAHWCAVLKDIDPHKPGATNQPREIVNPEPNHLGITQITIVRIRSSSPTSKSGKEYEIDAQQWFPAPKAAKSKTTAQKKGSTPAAEILIPSIALNGVENWVERDKTVKNWVEPDKETGLIHDAPDFGANALP